MLWIGYATFAKCALYSFVVCVVVPCIFSMIRRAERPDAGWDGADHNVLTNLAVEKFKQVE